MLTDADIVKLSKQVREPLWLFASVANRKQKVFTVFGPLKHRQPGSRGEVWTAGQSFRHTRHEPSRLGIPGADNCVESAASTCQNK